MSELQLFEADDTTPAADVDLGTIANAGVSATIERHLWNGITNPLAITAKGIRSTVYERLCDSGGSPVEDWNQNGRATKEGWMKCRAVDVDGSGITAQVTAWRPQGLNMFLMLLPIPAECARFLEYKLDVPPSTPTTEKRQLRIVIEDDFSASPVSLGFIEGGVRGICTLTGNQQRHGILQGGACTATGTPNNHVHFTTIVWRGAGGETHVFFTPDVTIADSDANSAATGAGEAFWATASVGASGVTITPGVKAADPVTVGAQVAWPDGEDFLAFIHFEHDGTIEQADIYQDEFLRNFADFTSSGLDGFVGPVVAMVDNALVDTDGRQQVTLTASADNTIWLQQTGLVEATVGSDAPVAPNPEPIWLATTDVSGVTALLDLRRFCGRERATLQFTFNATLSAGQKAYALLDGPASIFFPRPVVAMLKNLGTTPTAGATTFEIKALAAGTFTTIFPNGVIPSIAYNDTTQMDVDAIPEVVIFDGPTLFECSVAGTPTAGAAPGGAQVSLTFERA
jgi:hypothetical protein